MAPQICRFEETSPLGSSLDWISGGENAHLNSGEKELDLTEQESEASEPAWVRLKTALREDCIQVWGRKCIVLENDFFFSSCSKKSRIGIERLTVLSGMKNKIIWNIRRIRNLTLIKSLCNKDFYLKVHMIWKISELKKTSILCP